MKLKKSPFFTRTLLALIHFLYSVLFCTTLAMLTLQHVIAPRYDWEGIESRLTDEESVEPPEWCPPTTNDIEDLVVTEDMTREEAKEQTLLHGSAIVRDVIGPDTVKAFREYVMEENARSGLENFVLEGEHRAKIRLSHREAGRLMEEFASHPIVRPLVEDILGPQATLISLDVITNYHGAGRQEWHRDATYSKLNYPTKFVNEYSFTIPLQDTTAGMGATAICPGTHVCENPRIEDDGFKIEDLYNTDDDNDIDDNDDTVKKIAKTDDANKNKNKNKNTTKSGINDWTKVPPNVWNTWNTSAQTWDPDDLPAAALGFRNLYNSSTTIRSYYDTYESWIENELPFCHLRAELTAGDAFLFDIDVWHSGQAHVDPHAQERALLFLTFAESRTDVSDSRFYPLGAPYIMHWDSYGHTIDEFGDTEKWRLWTAAVGNLGDYVGYYVSWGYALPWFRPGRRLPWTIYDFCAVIYTADDETNDILVEGDWLTAKYLERKTRRLVEVSKASVGVYLHVLIVVRLVAGHLPKPAGLVLTGTVLCALSFLSWSFEERENDTDDDGEGDGNGEEKEEEVEEKLPEKGGEEGKGDGENTRTTTDGLPFFYLVVMVWWPVVLFPLIRFMKRHSARHKVKVV